MSAAEEGNGQQGSLAVSTEILRRVSEARRAEAELERLTQRMRSARQGEHLLAGENERRMELLKVAGRSHVPQDIARQRRDLTVITIGDLLFPWQVINLPYMDEGIDQVPGVAGTSGDIATAGLYAGGLGYAGMLEDDDASPPFAEKWWIHNWRNSQVLPAAPYDGHLYYRFTVDSECHIYQAPVFSGSVREFVTIGWTSDVASDPLASWTNWQTVGWPADQTLPSSNRSLGGSVPVTGSNQLSW